MSEIPRIKPPCLRDDAEQVLRRLREAGHIAYFAGGCVRDLLLGLEPKDWDVATDAPPKRVRELFRSTQAVGQAFGVILVRLGRSVVEVATFRAEGPYLDGRRPSQVRFTTAEEDARRRDFTINALFLDPDGDRVIDHVGGQDDLRQRILRAVGNPAERFAEDHLRLLRAVRFAARFTLEIDPATADSIGRDAPLLKRISPERIGDELRLMLTPPTRSVAWLLLRRFRLADVIFRFLPRQPLAELAPGRSIFLSTAPGGAIPFGLALAAACLEAQWHPPDDIRLLLQREPALRMDRAMRQALRISNDESADLVGAIEGPATLLRDDPPPVAAMKRFLTRPTSPLSRHLLEALAAVGERADRNDWLRAQLATLAAGEVAPPPLVTGDDLVAAGLSPGPRFKSILDAVYDAQLEDRVVTKDAAMTMALSAARHDG